MALAAAIDCYHAIDPATGHAQGIVLSLDTDVSHAALSLERLQDDDHLTAGITMRGLESRSESLTQMGSLFVRRSSGEYSR